MDGEGEESGHKYMSYCISISNYEKVGTHSIVVTSDVYLDLGLLKLFNVNNDAVFFF